MFQMKLACDRNGIVKYQLKGLLKELCLSKKGLYRAVVSHKLICIFYCVNTGELNHKHIPLLNLFKEHPFIKYSL